MIQERPKYHQEVTVLQTQVTCGAQDCFRYNSCCWELPTCFEECFCDTVYTWKQNKIFIEVKGFIEFSDEVSKLYKVYEK